MFRGNASGFSYKLDVLRAARARLFFSLFLYIHVDGAVALEPVFSLLSVEEFTGLRGKIAGFRSWHDLTRS